MGHARLKIVKLDHAGNPEFQLEFLIRVLENQHLPAERYTYLGVITITLALSGSISHATCML